MTGPGGGNTGGPIVVVREFMSAVQAETLMLREGEPLMEQVMNRWPQGFPNRQPKLYRNYVDDSTEITAIDSTNVIVSDIDHFIIILYPAGGMVSSIFSGLAKLMKPIMNLFAPDEAEDDGGYENERGAPVNAFRERVNTVRTGDRVPEHFGRNRVYPDKLTPPYTVYSGREVESVTHYILGRGDYDIEEVMIDQTILDYLPSSAYAFIQYGPDAVFQVGRVQVRNEGVERIELVAPNQFTEGVELNFRSGNAIHAFQDIWNSVTAVGQLVDIDSTGVGAADRIYYVTGIFDDGPGGQGRWYITVGEPHNLSFRTDPPHADISSVQAANRFSGYAYSVESDRLMVRENFQERFIGRKWFTIRSDDAGITSNIYVYTGSVRTSMMESRYDPKRDEFYSVKVDMRWIIFENPDGTDPGWTPYSNTEDPLFLELYRMFSNQRSIDPGASGNWTTWYRVPGITNMAQIDFEFPRGLYQQEAGEAPVALNLDVDMEWRKEGETALTGSRTVTYSANEQDGLIYSELLEFGTKKEDTTAWEIRLRRVTDYIYNATRTHVDAVYLRTLSAIIETDSHAFGDVTILRVELIGSQRTLALDVNKFNVIATRKLPTYDIVNDTIRRKPRASRNFADAAMYTLMAKDHGGLKKSEIDLRELYKIARDLSGYDNGQLVHFDHVFDRRMGLEAQLDDILSIARVTAYSLGNVVHFSRDESNKLPISVFNDRAKAPDREHMRFQMQHEDLPDGFVLKWRDENDDWMESRVILPLGHTPLNPQNYTAVGCTNWPQAWRLASYKWNLIQFRRDTLSITVTGEGMLFGPNDLLINADNIESYDWGGEVVEWAGNTLTMDRKIKLKGGNNVIVLRDNDGVQTDEVPVTQASDRRDQVILARPPTIGLGQSESAQRNLLFWVGKASERRRTRYLVQNVSAEGQYVRIDCANYAENEVYAEDKDKVLSQRAYERQSSAQIN